MKKSLIAVALILGVIALLPIIGNSAIKSTIDTKVQELKSLGLEVKVDESSSSYLHSSRHFELLLADSTTFIKYLSEYSDKQIPPYVNAMLNGVVLGMDLEYSNLPFSKAVSVDIYPLTLSPELHTSLTQNDIAFAQYVEKFLQSKGILYHMDYNLLNSEFKGNIKDIDENYTLKDGVDLKVILSKASFEGEGELMAPTLLSTQVKAMQIDATQKQENFRVNLDNFSSKSNFESQNTYVTSANIDSFDVELSGTEEDINISVKKVTINASSNDQADDVELNSQLSAESMIFVTSKENVNMQKFTMNIAVSGLDKTIYTELYKLMNNAQVQNQAMIQRKSLELISKGLVIDMPEFSLEKISSNELGELKGFDIKSKFTIKEDSDLLQKVQMSPLMAIANLEVFSNIKVSKKLFSKLIENQGMLVSLQKYAKEENDSFVFKIEFKDSKATINGKSLN